MSAVAALAVASPFAVATLSELASDASAAEHHEFVRAAVVTDLPGELMSALSQGLSQFGINLPPVPTVIGSGSMPVTSPGLISPIGMAPGLTSPGLTTPGLATPGLATPGLATPGATPGLATTELATTGAAPSLTDPGLTNPGLTSPAATVPGLTSPAGTGPTLPGLDGTGAGTGLIAPGEVPITTPVGLDPGLDGTYPILGDPYLGAMPAAGSGGLVSDLMSTANQLGAGQALDLLKSTVMPSIMQAAQGAAAPAAAAPAAAAAVAAPAS